MWPAKVTRLSDLSLPPLVPENGICLPGLRSGQWSALTGFFIFIFLIIAIATSSAAFWEWIVASARLLRNLVLAQWPLSPSLVDSDF